MSFTRIVTRGALLLMLFALPHLALARDLSTMQAAFRIAHDEFKAAEAERDADAQFVLTIETELEKLKKQQEAGRKKAEQSEKRYLEARKRYEQAQTGMDQASKR